MTISIFGPAVGDNIGPGTSVGVSTTLGPTALDDYFEVILRESTSGLTVCSGSTLAAGATTQIVFNGISRAFAPIIPTGGVRAFPRGIGITLEARLFHHSFALVDGPLTQTGFFWAPTEALWSFIQSVVGLNVGSGSAILAAVRRTYHNS